MTSRSRAKLVLEAHAARSANAVALLLHARDRGAKEMRSPFGALMGSASAGGRDGGRGRRRTPDRRSHRPALTGRTGRRPPQALGRRRTVGNVSASTPTESGQPVRGWGHDRSFRPVQDLRPDQGRRPVVVHRQSRHGDGIPRPERRRQVHHHADDPRSGQPHVRSSPHRWAALRLAQQTVDQGRRAARRELGASEQICPIAPALAGHVERVAPQAGRRGARHRRPDRGRRQGRRASSRSA